MSLKEYVEACIKHYASVGAAREIAKKCLEDRRVWIMVLDIFHNALNDVTIEWWHEKEKSIFNFDLVIGNVYRIVFMIAKLLWIQEKGNRENIKKRVERLFGLKLKNGTMEEIMKGLFNYKNKSIARWVYTNLANFWGTYLDTVIHRLDGMIKRLNEFKKGVYPDDDVAKIILSEDFEYVKNAPRVIGYAPILKNKKELLKFTKALAKYSPNVKKYYKLVVKYFYVALEAWSECMKLAKEVAEHHTTYTGRVPKGWSKNIPNYKL